MEWLNYHHLLYFWTVAKKGSVIAACEELRLRQPTISAQIQSLEDSIGEPLFERIGRKLILTETGKTVYKYADQIFSLGRELLDVVKDRPVNKTHQLIVGVNDVVPKLIAHKILKIAFTLKEKTHLVCREDSAEQLLADLAIHNIDLVISDAPIGTTANIKGFSHFLGECGVSFMAHGKLADRYRRNFPASLQNAPMLLPTENTSIRGQIDSFLHANDIYPEIVAEFQDSALLSMFGAGGEGIFIVPTAIEKDIQRQYGVEVIGRVPSIKERFYLITISRKIKNPAVQAISEAAKEFLLD